METLSRYGINVIFSQQLIDQSVKSKLVEKDILAFEGVNGEFSASYGFAVYIGVVNHGANDYASRY